MKHFFITVATLAALTTSAYAGTVNPGGNVPLPAQREAPGMSQGEIAWAETATQCLESDRHADAECYVTDARGKPEIFCPGARSEAKLAAIQMCSAEGNRGAQPARWQSGNRRGQ